MPFPFNLLLSFINPDKIGGWVRAAIGPVLTAGFAWAAAKLPFVSQFLTPELAATIAGSVSLFITGLLSNKSKEDKSA